VAVTAVSAAVFASFLVFSTAYLVTTKALAVASSANFYAWAFFSAAIKVSVAFLAVSSATNSAFLSVSILIASFFWYNFSNSRIAASSTSAAFSSA